MATRKKKGAPVKKRGPAKKKSKPRGKPPVPAADKKAEIRHAAFHCFSEHGFHDTRVDDICKMAGISKGSFYWYFESKETAFLDILETWADEVEQEVMAQFAEAFAGDNPADALLAALGREGRRGKKLMPLWLDGIVQARHNPVLAEALADFMQRVRDALAAVIRPAFSPYHAPEEVEALAGLLFSSFIGSITQELADPSGHHYEIQTQQLLVTTDRFAHLLAADGSTGGKKSPRKRKPRK
jgi:AcrR family transcriptional regulator